MLCYAHYETREDWLAGRGHSIGASEAGAIVGVSKWMTATELWEVKTGKRARKDLSANSAVNYGVLAEPYIRGLFMAKHPELSLDYKPYDILSQDERPWMTATLDGELTDTNGKRYVLEIKTASPSSRAEWDEWNGRVKDQYFAQILHQLLVTGWDGVYLYAELIGRNGNSQLREYYFDREDYEGDMEWLLEKETEFWHCVESGKRPKVTLALGV